MHAIIFLIDSILQLYGYVLIAWVVLSWLIAFNVVNTHNRFVYILSDVLYRLTEPVLRPIRRIIPNIGGLDVSPLVLFLIIQALQVFLLRDVL